MSYQVLARKWRPKTFPSISGQQHVVKALMNALELNRLHHAYLFTGTRGVGKTTIARILAKALNCEQGISSQPCDNCTTCKEINAGCFIDLIEVDAASRTKVEDTRELLENVQYASTKGRYKIYLIDEVHMLSNHSFNALLKTLEEPPSHVKFLLATTDPQKLPITVLSRCLQFHLKCLSCEQISTQLAFILDEEQIPYEQEALKRLAYAASGSMRDALSLLDHAIAYGKNSVETANVLSMLGTIEATHLYDMMDALAVRQPRQLLTVTQHLAEKAADFQNVLEELLSLLHHMAMLQLIPDCEIDVWDRDKILQLSQKFSAEDIQLFYQIALIGRRDLALAPSPKSGFEMILLRMFAFQPTQDTHSPLTPHQPLPEVTKPVAIAKNDLPSMNVSWQEILQQLNLRGITAAIAAHCTLKTLTEHEAELLLDPSQAPLFNKKQEERLANALSDYFQRPIRLTIQIGNPNMDTPAVLEQKKQDERQTLAEQAIRQDENVKQLLETFNGKISNIEAI